MVYISRLFITVLTFISFFSWGESLDGKYVVCNRTEETKKSRVVPPVLGLSFKYNKVVVTRVSISENGVSKEIYNLEEEEYITSPDFIKFYGFPKYQLDRKNLELIIHYSQNGYYYNCELLDKNNYKKTIEKYAEIEQDAVREAWKKATEGNKI